MTLALKAHLGQRPKAVWAGEPVSERKGVARTAVKVGVVMVEMAVAAGVVGLAVAAAAGAAAMDLE